MTDSDKLQTIDNKVSGEEAERVVRATYTEYFPLKIILHSFELIFKSPTSSF